jgi:hypothetical protein
MRNGRLLKSRLSHKRVRERQRECLIVKNNVLFYMTNTEENEKGKRKKRKFVI